MNTCLGFLIAGGIFFPIMPKMLKIMEEIMKSPRAEKHPSFGYATEDEIKKLQTMGLCPERDMILKAIEKRTAMKGKSKR